MPSELRTERRDATLLLTISDPATRNALSDQVYAAGIEALDTAEPDAQLRCVILQGEGANFCSGGDVRRLAMRRSQEPAASTQSIERFHQFIQALRAFPKPVIACVEGAAAGGGFSLALACDLIVAAQNARFSMAYGRIGLSPDGGGVWQLARALPRPLVTQLLWLGETLGAAQLQAHGIVNWVTDAGLALPRSMQVATQLAESCAANALASAKELLQSSLSRGLHEHLACERDHFLENLFHANGGEGLAAFLDQRAAHFE